MSREVPVQSVRKALDMLTMLAFDDLERTGVPLTTVARRMGMPSNSAHNLLKTMAACGYVAQTEGGAYRLGPRSLALGRVNALLSAAVSSVVRSHMEALADDLGESVVFAALVDGRRVPLWQVEGRQAVRVDSASAETRGVFALPTGRVLAAFATPEDLDLLLERSGLPGADWDRILTRPRLEAALARIRARGYEAITPDDREFASFAVPVRNDRDQVIGSLGCYAPLFRCGPERQSVIVETMLLTAKAILQEI